MANNITFFLKNTKRGKIFPMNKDKALKLQEVTALFDIAWITYKKYFRILLNVNWVPVIISMFSLSVFTFLGSFEYFSQFLTKYDFIDIVGLVFGATIITIVTISVNYIAQIVALSRSADAGDSAGIEADPNNVVTATNTNQNQTSVYSIYAEAASKLFPYFWIMLLSGLIVFVGFILLIVPGIVFSVWFAFASFVLILGNEKGTAALKKSKKYVRGIWLEVFLRFIAAALLGFLLSAALGILQGFVKDVFASQSDAISIFLDFAYQLIITPYFVVYGYELYKDVVRVNEEIPKVEVKDEMGG